MRKYRNKILLLNKAEIANIKINKIMAFLAKQRVFYYKKYKIDI